MSIGALLAGADDEQLEIVLSVARDVGMAFQIQDDILDVTSTTSELGKPVHSDEKNDKITYVSLYGIEKAHSDVKQYSEKALSIFDTLEVKNEFLYTLTEKLINRRK